MRTTRRLALASLAAPLAAPAIARAATVRRWRCVTSWSRDMIGPGVAARRLVEAIAAMSGGELQIELFAAGEIAPAFGVFDAVAAGTVEMGHTASFFQQGKTPVAALFTTAPFGLGPRDHAAWLDAGGQALWDKLYARAGVRGRLAGNTGPSSAGWFRHDIKSLDDVKGLRMRVAGLGGEIYRSLGAVPIVTAPADTYPALERGVIDAAEFLAPANDLPLGLHKVAPFLAFPGFDKPNGASEAVISLKAWEGLSASLKAIVEAACRAEHDRSLSEAGPANARALTQLLGQGVKLMSLPDDMLTKARLRAGELLGALGGEDALAGEIVASYRAALASGESWRRASALSQARLL